MGRAPITVSLLSKFERLERIDAEISKLQVKRAAILEAIATIATHAATEHRAAHHASSGAADGSGLTDEGDASVAAATAEVVAPVSPDHTP